MGIGKMTDIEYDLCSATPVQTKVLYFDGNMDNFCAPDGK